MAEVRRWRCFIAMVGWLAIFADFAAADALRGSRHSLALQVRVVLDNDFTLLETASHVRRFVELGLLVAVPQSADVRLSGVSFPVARPEVRTFVQRLGAQYRRACGEKLVVTSLTRPKSRQPRNAFGRSVHRAGLGVDLRRSPNPGCRRWLERVLRSLERKGLIEATRERHPAHYHVAVFPKRYRRYVAGLEHTAPRSRLAIEVGESRRYAVRRGDTLWAIARRHGMTVRRLRDANHLRGKTLVAGQSLRIPLDS